jgi:hypothetical protein
MEIERVLRKRHKFKIQALDINWQLQMSSLRSRNSVTAVKGDYNTADCLRFQLHTRPKKER